MNEKTVKEWIKKADHDLKIGKDEYTTKDPVTDMICFHMQQCVEKYLKAYLIFHGKEIKRTHIIEELIKECKNIDPDFQKLIEFNTHILTGYAVEVRYPGEFPEPSLEETKEAIKIAEKVRNFVLKKLKEKGINF